MSPQGKGYCDANEQRTTVPASYPLDARSCVDIGWNGGVGLGAAVAVSRAILGAIDVFLNGTWTAEARLFGDPGGEGEWCTLFLV